MLPPTGTLTFLFTDIERSTQLWEQKTAAMQQALAQHDAILRQAIELYQGYLIKGTGDGFHAAFASASDAIAVCLAAQHALHAHTWGETPIKVRMGLHTGQAEYRDGDYFGPALNRAARLMSVGHGGQILLSAATQELVRDALPSGCALRDLGVHRLKDIISTEHIYQLVAPALPADFPPLKTAERRIQLPAPATPFVGRAREIGELMKLLLGQDLTGLPARLVTIVGAGGMGKTRLAIEVAIRIGRGEAMPRPYTHGVFFASLAPLNALSSIVPTIAEALGFAFYQGSEPKQQLLDYLREKNLLLIIDNCEHLLDGMTIISDILQLAPRVQIIATSRERLRLPEEQVYAAQGLEFPQSDTGRLGEGRTAARGTATLRAALEEPDYDAARLFLQCAHRIKPNFTLSSNDSRYLKRICRLVQGMPLGIELAAAWVDMLALEEIAVEIAKNTDFLASDARAIPERQRSLRAVFSYSWNLLGETERKALQQLSVFRGGFTREAAHVVTGTSLGALTMLAHKSFLYRTQAQTSDVSETSEVSRVSRYELHELMRQYAASQLGQAPKLRDVVRERHSAYYLDWLHHKTTELKGSKQLTALNEIESEIDNVDVAWAEAVAQGHVERIAQAIDPLCHFYERRGRYVEGEEACRAAVHGWGVSGQGAGDRGQGIEEPSPATQLQAQSPALSGIRGIALVKALAWQGAFCHTLGRTGQAKELLRQSLTALEQMDMSVREVKEARAFALGKMGDVTRHDGNRDEAKRLCEESLALYREIANPWGEATVLSELGKYAVGRGQYAEARQFAEDSLSIRRGLDDRRGIADSLDLLGTCAGYLGQLDEGARLAQEALIICRELNDPQGIAYMLSQLAIRLYHNGKFAEVKPLFEESIAHYKEIGDRQNLGTSTYLLGVSYQALGEYRQGQVWLQQGLELSKEVKNPLTTASILKHLSIMAYVQMDYVQAQHLVQESITYYQTINQRGDMASPIAFLGMTIHALHQPAKAQQLAHEALQLVIETHNFWGGLQSLGLLAVLLTSRNEITRAVEIYALVRHHPFARARYIEDIFGRVVDEAATQLPPDVVVAAQARGQARDWYETAKELLNDASLWNDNPKSEIENPKS